MSQLESAAIRAGVSEIEIARKHFDQATKDLERCLWNRGLELESENRELKRTLAGLAGERAK